jgi:putative hydrolase of the HAD superfamily
VSRAPRGVLFDAAGTLLRLRAPVGETYARFAEAHGCRIPPSRLEEAFARVLAKAPPMVFPGRTLADAEREERRWWWHVVDDTLRAADASARPRDFEGFFDALFAHYATPDAWELAPGAASALHALRAARLATGIVSNFDHRLRNLLQALGIHHLFDTVTLPSDCGAAKPDRAIFEVALKRLGLAGPLARYVGDRDERDVAAARAAGLRAVRVDELATLADLPRRLAVEEAGAWHEGR